MADVTIPQELAELQAWVDRAFDAVEQHRKGVGMPGSEWSAEERQRSDELLDEATTLAQELRDAITASGLEREHGSAVFQPALKQAAREA